MIADFNKIVNSYKVKKKVYDIVFFIGCHQCKLELHNMWKKWIGSGNCLLNIIQNIWSVNEEAASQRYFAIGYWKFSKKNWKILAEKLIFRKIIDLQLAN